MATQFNRPSPVGGGASKPRAPRINLAPMRDRIVKSIRGPEPDDHPDEPWVAFALEAERGSAEEILPRFAIVRQGYDCVAVDEYITELERELAETDRELADVRGKAQSADEVNRELKRIGEQTSAVLIAAHEQHDAILRAAREEADRCVSEATAKASALTADVEARRRQLETQNDATRRERDRLLDNVRGISAAMAALAETETEPKPPPSSNRPTTAPAVEQPELPPRP